MHVQATKIEHLNIHKHTFINIIYVLTTCIFTWQSSSSTDFKMGIGIIDVKIEKLL